MIPQRNISLITNELAIEGGRRISEATVELDYVLAWFLTCLAEHPLRNRLAFKGGTALRRCWFDGYRFSDDLDFTLTEPCDLRDILAAFVEICGAVEAASEVQFQLGREGRHQGQNTHTIYLRYQGPLPATNDVKVDITMAEAICFPLQERPVLRQYELFDDLPEGPLVMAYSLEEIVVEKLVALSDRARNEPRDIYDLWYLLQSQDFWLPGLQHELNSKLAFRKRPTGNILQAVTAKEEHLRHLWGPRLSQQMSNLPPYDNVFRDVIQVLRAANLDDALRAPRYPI